jgi:hypothetical protein
VLRWAAANPEKVAAAGSFGVGVLDPHPPGASPLDMPGPFDDLGRGTRAVGSEVADDVVRASSEIVDDSVRAAEQLVSRSGDDAARSGSDYLASYGDDLASSADDVVRMVDESVQLAQREIDDILNLVSKESKPGRELFADVRQALVQSEHLTAAQKTDVFEKAALKINQIDPSWMANRGPATNAAGFFTGDARPFGFAIDQQGRLWQTLDFTKGVEFGPNMMVTIDYSKWTLVQ